MNTRQIHTIILTHRLVIFSSFVFLFLHFELLSQNNLLQHYTGTNGLASNGIKGLVVDTMNDFLWVGTEGGLVRFDGSQFKLFQSEGGHSFSQRVYNLGRTDDGKIYWQDEEGNVSFIKENLPGIKGFKSGLSYYEKQDTNRFPTMGDVARFLVKQNYLVSDKYIQYSHGQDSLSLYFTLRDSTCFFNSESNRLVLVENLPNCEFLFRIGKYVFAETKDYHFYRILPDYKAKLIAIRGIGDNNNAQDEMRLILEALTNKPIIIGKNKLWVLDYDEKSDFLNFTSFCDDCLPPGQDITHVCLWEKYGTLFLGTRNNGLFVYRKPIFKTIPQFINNAENAKAVYGQIELEQDTILDLRNSRKIKLDGTVEPYNRKLGEFSNSLKDSDGNNWFARGDSILKFNAKSYRISVIPTGLNAIDMQFQQAGSAMYAVNSYSIGIVKNDVYHNLRRPPTLFKSDNYMEVNDFTEWSPGVLAVGSTKYILLYDTARRTLDTVYLPGNPARVRTFWKNKGYCFIGTYGGGFYMARNNSIKRMPEDRLNRLRYVHCFLQDSLGFVWLSTNSGIFRVKLDNLIEAYEKDLKEINYQYFGIQEGIDFPEFNGNCHPCAVTLSNGKLSFPGMGGFVIFNPSEIKFHHPGRKIFIDDIKANDLVLSPGDERLQQLSYRTNNLSFDICVPSWMNSGNLYLSYQLEPLSNEWLPVVSVDNNIMLGTLPPGKYHLHIRCRNGDNNGDFARTSIEFTILPPWYKTWWVYFLYFIFLLASVVVIVKWRTTWLNKKKIYLEKMVKAKTELVNSQNSQLIDQLEQLNQKKQELEIINTNQQRLLSIISHDIISPVKFIGYVADKIKGNEEEKIGAFRKEFTSIVSVSHELENLIVNLLDWIKFSNKKTPFKADWMNAFQLVESCIEIPRIIAKSKGIQFKNDIKQDLEIFHYRDVLSVIIYNLAMNAAKYTDTGSITVDLGISNQDIHIVVEDTGPGMPDFMLEKINDPYLRVIVEKAEGSSRPQFGFVIISNLLKLVNGNLEVRNVSPHGTNVSVTLPDNIVK